MISLIIPAYNEESLIGQTLDALHQAAKATGIEYEIIVVDDASTDRTAEIAQSRGAKVVSVSLRQIAAVRNAGARVAAGDTFLFVDADTIVSEQTLRAALDALRRGAVGGGSQVRLEGKLPLLGRLYFQVFLLVWRPLKLAAGCFIFARRAAFEAVGGFDERFFASEEIWLSKALKSQGKFVIVSPPVISSGRKARMYTTWQLLSWSIKLLAKGPPAWQKREGLELWYEGRRESPTPNEKAAK